MKNKVYIVTQYWDDGMPYPESYGIELCKAFLSKESAEQYVQERNLETERMSKFSPTDEEWDQFDRYIDDLIYDEECNIKEQFEDFDRKAELKYAKNYFQDKYAQEDIEASFDAKENDRGMVYGPYSIEELELGD